MDLEIPIIERQVRSKLALFSRGESRIVFMWKTIFDYLCIKVLNFNTKVSQNILSGYL